MDNFPDQWAAVEAMLFERFGKQPDMEAILFLIGLNELGAPDVKKYTKEQKQDVMHVAVCALLCQLGFYEFAGTDEDGWPHYHELQRPGAAGLADQERLLKECIVRYFQ